MDKTLEDHREGSVVHDMVERLRVYVILPIYAAGVISLAIAGFLALSLQSKGWWIWPMAITATITIWVIEAREMRSLAQVIKARHDPHVRPERKEVPRSETSEERVPDAYEPSLEHFAKLKFASTLVEPSYSWALQRMEAVDSRLHTLLVFMASFTTAMPILAKALDATIPFGSRWFIAALALALVIGIVGTLARAWGTLNLIDLGVLRDPSWMEGSSIAYLDAVIYWAADHLDKNRHAINVKGWTASVLTGLFAAEAACMVVWLATTL